MDVADAERPRRMLCGMELDFIAARYHRGFLDELPLLQQALFAERDAGRDEMANALACFGVRLARHELFQRLHIFPAFEAARPCPPSIADAWAMDALRLFALADSVRETSALVERELALRIRRLLDDVQDHLAIEARLIGGWTAKTRQHEG